MFTLVPLPAKTGSHYSLSCLCCSCRVHLCCQRIYKISKLSRCSPSCASALPCYLNRLWKVGVCNLLHIYSLSACCIDLLKWKSQTMKNFGFLWIVLLTTFFFQSENNRVLVNIYLQRKERILQSENKIPKCIASTSWTDITEQFACGRLHKLG